MMHAAPQIGSILLGKYRVERVLGQGGMGVVVAARHEHLGELFAIKMMLPEALRYQDARERFMREARAVARMKGEHVARVHDVGMLDNGAPCMVMEYLTGEDLSGVLDNRGVLPVGEAALYVYQACEAVAEAHAIGVVHRDLKPANMFLTRRPNDTPCVKVLDFGISKDLDPNKVGPALTKTGMFLGTPVYMAPEQMANNKAIDARSDIWSLGVILYELTTGQVPFLAESMTELVTQVITASPLPPSHVRPDIPYEFSALIMRCLEKQRDRRFSSVRELMAALHPFVGMSVSPTFAGYQSPTATPRPGIPDTTTVERPRPMMPSSPPAMPVALQATVHAPPTFEAMASGSARALSVPFPEPRQTNGAWGGTSGNATDKRGKTWVIAGLAVGGLVVLGLTGWMLTRGNTPEKGSVASPVALPSSSPQMAAVQAQSAVPVVEETAPKPQEQVKPAASAAASKPNVTNATETKPPVKKGPITKVPDF